MKKIYTEKIHQSTRFGLIDEDGRKTPCGTLWSPAVRLTIAGDVRKTDERRKQPRIYGMGQREKKRIVGKMDGRSGAGKTLQARDIQAECADGRVCRSRTRNSRSQQMLRNVRTL